MIWLDLNSSNKKEILLELEQDLNLSPVAIEKDWWVTMVLHALFNTSFASELTFKGGTSLSKAWNIIKRFSEDVDITINREFLGFPGELSKTQISDKLRRASCTFVRDTIPGELEKQLLALGIHKSSFCINVNITTVSTVDPEVITIEYKSVLDNSQYIKPRVLIEIGARSMAEPFTIKNLQSFIGAAFPNFPFADKPFPASIVLPERTFLEKAFLMHEEFAKPSVEIRSNRMSRHLYDLEKLSHTIFATNAINDTQLYKTVLLHRKKFIGLKGFDYNSLLPATINFCPPEALHSMYENDYKSMQATMIYEKSLPFAILLEQIQKLNEKFRQIPILTLL